MKIHPPEYYFSGPHLEIAQALLRGDAATVAQRAPGQDLDAPGREDMTLLFYALQCAFGEKPAQLGALTALVRAGADPFRESPNVGSPLGVALRSKSPDYVRAFLDGGVDPSAKNGHGTPILHQAANHHTVDTFRLLIERGADINARDSLASTTLDTAFSEQQYDIVDALLDLGADPNTFDVLGVSFAYSIQFALSRETPGTPAHQKMVQIRDRIIAMGVQWPPIEPPEMRDWMRSQGMKVVVPAGHQR